LQDATQWESFRVATEGRNVWLVGSNPLECPGSFLSLSLSGCVQQDLGTTFVTITNWFDGLRRRAPVNR
jgi:hypothetical protein